MKTGLGEGKTVPGYRRLAGLSRETGKNGFIFQEGGS